MKLLLSIFISILAIYNCYAQVSEEWVKKLNGSGNSSDAGNAMVIDASGNIIVTGHVTNPGTGKDIVTIKYSPLGQVLWTTYFNGSTNRDDVGRFIIIDNSGNIYVSGTSDSLLSNSDFMTIKYNSAGVQQWAVRYYGGGFGSGTDFPVGIAIDNIGNVYTAGTSIGSGTSYDIAIIKYNSIGMLQWLDRYDSTQDEASGIAIDAAANVYVSGKTGNMFTLLKYSTSGTRQWVRNYSTTVYSTGLALDNSGNIFITGYTMVSSNYLTLKYSPSGVQEWVNTYNGPANSIDQAYMIKTDNAGSVYVTGASFGTGSQSDIATVKYSNSGSQLWVQRFNGLGNSYDWPTSISIDNIGNLYIAGRSIGYSNTEQYVSMKYDSSGVMNWTRYYDGSADGNDAANSIITDNLGNIYVTGFSNETGSSTDITTIKYTSITRHDFVSGPFVSLPNQFLTNNTYNIKTRIFNNSTVAESNVPVKWFVNSTQVNTANISLVSGKADTLSNFWTPTVPGTYELKYISSLSNDIDRANDTVKINVQVFTPPLQSGSIRICRNRLNIPTLDNSTSYDTIFVNIPFAISVLDVNVKIDTVLHTWDSDLEFAIKHLTVLDSIITNRGGSGDNFIGTNLNDSALIPISSGTAPFTGTYRPDRPLSVFNGLNPNGAWILRIKDGGGGDTGLLRAWCIEIQYDYFTGITNTGNIPQQFSLSQNYPNPFNPTTTIKFGISEMGFVKLKVFDVLGREVDILVNEEMKPGNYEAAFTGEDLPSGIYFYSLVTPQFTDVKKMVLIK